MSDPTQTQAGQPSEEELRAYLEQLRGADPAELVAQAFSMLGTGAEVKLGRPDARTLIDAMGALTDAIDGKVPAELTDSMRNGVSQLQMAQVQAERQAGGEPRQQTAEQASAGRPADKPRQDPQQRMTDRLWIPGRDQPPPRS